MGFIFHRPATADACREEIYHYFNLLSAQLFTDIGSAAASSLGSVL